MFLSFDILSAERFLNYLQANYAFLNLDLLSVRSLNFPKISAPFFIGPFFIIGDCVYLRKKTDLGKVCHIQPILTKLIYQTKLPLFSIENWMLKVRKSRKQIMVFLNSSKRQTKLTTLSREDAQNSEFRLVFLEELRRP